jgi:hypothetical protein
MVTQKTYRKYGPLTELQIKRLQKLSEFDGTDPVEHIRNAVDKYLQNLKVNFTPPKEEEIFAELKNRYEDPNISRAVWFEGIVDRYEFSALILNAPYKLGIDKGRISKLSIWDPIIKENTHNFISACIVNYDRGWDIRPSKIAQPYYNKVKSLIDSSLR